MKIPCVLLLLILAATARGEDPKPHAATQIASSAPARKVARPNISSEHEQKLIVAAEPPLEPARLSLERPATNGVSLGRATLLIERPAPYQISFGRYTVDGIGVQLLKTDKPLQLINPDAPEQYGSSDQNLDPDFISNKAPGLKILELRF
jgi:hypothetical protein